MRGPNKPLETWKKNIKLGWSQSKWKNLEGLDGIPQRVIIYGISALIDPLTVLFENINMSIVSLKRPYEQSGSGSGSGTGFGPGNAFRPGHNFDPSFGTGNGFSSGFGFGHGIGTPPSVTSLTSATNPNLWYEDSMAPKGGKQPRGDTGKTAGTGLMYWPRAAATNAVPISAQHQQQQQQQQTWECQ